MKSEEILKRIPASTPVNRQRSLRCRTGADWLLPCELHGSPLFSLAQEVSVRFRRNLVAGVTAALVATAVPASLPSAANAADGGKPQLKPATATAVSSSAKKGPVISLGDGPGAETYIVELDAPAVPTRKLAKLAPAQKTPTATAYRKSIRNDQAALQSSIRGITGKNLDVRFTYTNALNGFAVRLTRAQAAKTAQLPGVAAVTVDIKRKLNTDVGPEWIGAPTVWDGSNVPGGVGSKGEGEVAGVIDTGINAANPSFAESVPVEDGGDGYVVQNPRSKYYGVCDPANTDGTQATGGAYIPDWGCNGKLIGYYNFLSDATDGGTNYDYENHGSHTASTVAGNQTNATTYSDEGGPNEFSVTRQIKGVAPHANIIAYAACCEGSALLAAIDQAITDQVDSINYSIGSSSPTGDAWSEVDAKGFLNARAAGINVAVSAGNDGPGASTLGSPADVPWVTSVGATQHDRQWQAHVEDIAAGESSLPDIDGVGFSAPTDGSFPVIDGKDAGDELCHLADAAHPTAAHLDPAKVAGKIVICLRGDNGRVEKGENVASLGGKGMILANDAASGTSLNADAHALPAVHITYDDGVALRAWLATHAADNPTASLSGGVEHIGDDVADIMAAFSSRGPNRNFSLVGPSVSAPGVDILAAGGKDNEVKWEFISGTSMASPHTAGALTLLDAVQPDWTPAERQSALMTTAVEAIKDDDGTDADWFDMGSGRIDLTKAAKAGFVLDETYADYVAANPAAGGDVRTLNLASMADNNCLAECSWTRKLTGTSTGVGTWTVSVSSSSPDLELQAGSSTVDLTAGGTADLNVSAQIAPGASTTKWLMGEVTLTPPDGSDAPAAHLPVAVLPTNGVLPQAIDITTRRDAGSQETTGFKTLGSEDLQATPSGLVPGTTKQLELVQDPTNDDVWDGDEGIHVEHLTVPEGAARLVAKLQNATASDMDLYVGSGEVAEENLICTSATATANESCDIATPPAGDVWVLVQNWEKGSGATDTVDLVTAVVGGDEGNLTVTVPSSVEKNEPYSITTAFDESDMDPGETWYGAITLGTAPDSTDDIGIIPVNVDRVEDDVTVAADKATAQPGDVITYTVDIASNVTPKDLDYTVTAPIPAGTTYVEGSATDGATFADGKVTFAKTLKTAFGDPGSYSWTTNDEDASCKTQWAPGGGGYIDLESLAGITPDDTVSGDNAVFKYFGGKTFGFYDKEYDGLTGTDDGFLFFGDDLGTDAYLPQQVPDEHAPNGVLSALWQDQQVYYDADENSGVTAANAGNFVILEYDNMRAFDDAGGAMGSLDYEFTINAGTRDYAIAYDNVQLGSGALFDGVTIGAESPDGKTGSALVNKASASTVIHDGLVACATYVPAVAEGTSFTYQVKVDTDPATIDNGALTNVVTSTTSDPAAKPVDVTSTVNVTGVVEASTATVALDPTTITVGGTSTATATVTSTGPTPAGQVEFLVDGTVATTGALDGTGKATATLSGIGVGSHAVTARYLGNATTAGDTSDAATLVVSEASSAVSLSLNPTTVRVGGSSTATATVTSAGPTPTGQVQFLVDGKVAKTSALTGSGTAAATLTGLASGNHSVVAHYLGSDTTAEASSAAATLKVVPKAKPVVKVSGGSVKVGKRPKVTVTVKASGATATGVVKISVKQGNQTRNYTVKLVKGRGVVTLAKVKKTGNLKVVAKYAGDANVAAGTGRSTIKVRR